MRIIAKKMLREFWEIHPDAEQALRAWYTKTKQADWESTSDVKKITVMPVLLPTIVLYST
jgi:mRNA interferase HigB